ncbi:MAG: TetR/AcrR family transcriptional regulator [Clostridia bacterium]|nr:TetR/AcrR family transcriptional regulator [Clostridia bacterium]
MDLRMVKTRGQIKTAFLSLRERLMPEKIKVKDICEMAQINKTTFYHHYTDSNELSREIEDSAIDLVMMDFVECDQMFDNPRAYIVGLLCSLEKQSEDLRIIFRGKQEILCARLEERLHALYNPTVKPVEDHIKISFAIGGFVRVVRDFLFLNKKYDIDQVIHSTVRLLEAVSVAPTN